MSNSIRRLTLEGTIRNSDTFMSAAGTSRNFLGIDGCIFTSDTMDQVDFAPALMGTIPSVKVGGKPYFLSFDGNTPLMFFGSKVDIYADKDSVRVIDEVGTRDQKIYRFKTAIRGVDGKNLLIA